MIFLREAGDASCLMLKYAALQVICDARAKDARCACEDLDVLDVAAHVTKCAINPPPIALWRLSRCSLNPPRGRSRFLSRGSAPHFCHSEVRICPRNLSVIST